MPYLEGRGEIVMVPESIYERIGPPRRETSF